MFSLIGLISECVGGPTAGRLADVQRRLLTS